MKGRGVSKTIVDQVQRYLPSPQNLSRITGRRSNIWYIRMLTIRLDIFVL